LYPPPTRGATALERVSKWWKAGHPAALDAVMSRPNAIVVSRHMERLRPPVSGGALEA